MASHVDDGYTSQLPQPSRRASPRKMADLSASQFNARSTMPPPNKIPKVQRETLADRVQDFSNSKASTHPASRSGAIPVKATSLAHSTRQNGFASSTSAIRPPSSASSRNTSNSSFASSLGPGSNYPQGSRPQSALSNPKYQRANSILNRPSTSMDVRIGPQGVNRPGKRKGMAHFPTVVERPHFPLRSVSSGVYETRKYSSAEWDPPPLQPRSIREISLSTAMGDLTIEDHEPCSVDPRDKDPCVPFLKRSCIPVRSPSKFGPMERPCKSPRKTPKAITPFLSRDSNVRAASWENEESYSNFTSTITDFMTRMDQATKQGGEARALAESYKLRVSELEAAVEKATSNYANLQADVDVLHAQHARCDTYLQDANRTADIRLDDAERQYRHGLADAKMEKEEELRTLTRKHSEELTDLRRQLEDAIEDEKARRRKEIESLTSEGAISQQRAELKLEEKEQYLRSTRQEVEAERANTIREQEAHKEIQIQLATATSNINTLESANQTLRAHITFLESDSKSQSHAFADLEMRMQSAIKGEAEAMDKLRVEESLRRKLHNQVQELKGNIRVFCRVRPTLEAEDEAAKISFPDREEESKEVEVLGQPEKSSLGKVTTKTHPFSFDRVFSPKSSNADIFGEINQLVQSALDGYNVCIFCYGQTGSGKTFTMSSDDGMISRATRQIYDTARSLEEKGWSYSMEGSFVEVYNENVNDLLGKAGDLDKRKHEIQHDLQSCKTTITGVNTVDLDSPSKVEVILQQAAANRSVAATQANERSSRSHSVFILKLKGQNSVTGERSEGTLNLVDLAGSERLSHSQATGERLKETQSINKSLSCLGDVIGALGQGKEGGHVPYRNSKLTYLLQFSLGGNSKTLMFVMVSPLQAHLSETLTSLKFATKVHNTHIGTAKKQSKVH